MIHEVDESLRQLVLHAVDGSGVDIAFDAPTKDWAARRNTPTVNVYLYDVREDLDRRDVEFEEVRDARGRVVERKPPPRRFKLSYLVTVWTQRPEDEHRLLSTVLACFLRHDELPDDVLSGTLAETPHGTFLSIALPPPKDRSLADVWSALGGELKPSLDLVVTAPLDSKRVAAVGPPVLEEPRISVVQADGDGPAPDERRGSRPGRAAGARAGEEAAPVEPVEETISAGKPEQPGRVIRVRTIGDS